MVLRQRIGYALGETALWLYCAAQTPETPAQAQVVICGALGYCMLPFAVVSAAEPLIGDSDDLTVRAAALPVAAIRIDAEVKVKVKTSAKPREWLDGARS